MFISIFIHWTSLASAIWSLKSYFITLNLIIYKNLTCSVGVSESCTVKVNFDFILTFYILFDIFRLHRIQEMQTIVTHMCSVCQSVCLSCGSTWLHCERMAEWIKILFGMNTHGGPWNIVGLDICTARQTGVGKIWPIVDSLEWLKLETRNFAHL